MRKSGEKGKRSGSFRTDQSVANILAVESLLFFSEIRRSLESEVSESIVDLIDFHIISREEKTMEKITSSSRGERVRALRSFAIYLVMYSALSWLLLMRRRPPPVDPDHATRRRRCDLCPDLLSCRFFFPLYVLHICMILFKWCSCFWKQVVVVFLFGRILFCLFIQDGDDDAGMFLHSWLIP